MAVRNVQWFPFYQSESAQFSTGKLGGVAELTFSLDTYPTFWYGYRVTVSYELPDEFWSLNYDFKKLMLDGGVDLDISTSFDLTQQNITRGGGTSHTINITGSRGTAWHSFAVPYGLRGGNNIKVTHRRLSSYPPLVVAAQVVGEVVPTVYGTLVLARGVEGEGAGMPPLPGSTGYPGSAG